MKTQKKRKKYAPLLEYAINKLYRQKMFPALLKNMERERKTFMTYKNYQEI